MTSPDAIDELLLRWQELRRQGLRPTVEELCADRPSLAEELTRRVAAFESMEALLGVGQTATLAESHPEHDHAHRHLAEKLLPLGYELLDLIDQGGMGVVYKANQVKLGRVVALKMIAGFRTGRKQLARFRVEVEAVARLQHPHIVQIHEVGEVDGHSFFSMEYVAGGNLAHHLADGPMAPLTAAELLRTIARAVHHAHSRGVVHRDLKPANILLGVESRNVESPKVSDDGLTEADVTTLRRSDFPTPKVSDFGLAKQLGVEGGHTATGEVLGTPGYMAPEQAEGKTDAVGTAADVYALGAILYECLTGRPPFQGKTILETLRQVVSDEPISPRRLRPGIPRDLEAICLKCLEKNPTRRYPSAEVLAVELDRFIAGLPVTARPLSWTGRLLKWAGRRPALVSVLLLLVLGAAGAAGWAYAERAQQRARVTRRAVEVAPQAQEILYRHCYECHGANPAKAGRKFLVLDRASLLDAARKNVVPGKPEDSRLIHRIEDGTMPPEEDELRLPRVSEQELVILREWIAGGAPPFPAEEPHPTAPPPLAAEVKAIFIEHCYECHSRKEARGGIKIMHHDLLTAKRKVVIPGQPDESELYQLLVTADENLVMPPQTQPRMTAAEIDAVRRWIEEGAPPFPRSSPGR